MLWENEEIFPLKNRQENTVCDRKARDDGFVSSQGCFSVFNTFVLLLTFLIYIYLETLRDPKEKAFFNLFTYVFNLLFDMLCRM